MMFDRRDVVRVAVLVTFLYGATAARAGVPTWLPRYDVVMNVDVAGHCVAVQMRATWTNPHLTPTDKLVFNAHSHYVVPDADFPLMAKTLELLRVNPSDELGETEPACEVRKVTLVDPTVPFPAPPAGDAEPGRLTPPLANAVDVPFRYEGDTNTSLVVPLSHPVRQGEAISVVLDITMKLPQKQGRWGQWRGVTFLSNWLPVFAYYGDGPEPRPGEENRPRPKASSGSRRPSSPGTCRSSTRPASTPSTWTFRPTSTSPAPAPSSMTMSSTAAAALSQSAPTASATSPSFAAPVQGVRHRPGAARRRQPPHPRSRPGPAAARTLRPEDIADRL